MNKFFILVLIFIALSCQKEARKKVAHPIPAPLPVILVEGKSVFIDSVLLKPFGGKILKEFYLATGFKSVWQSKKDRRIILEQLINSEEEGLNLANYAVNKLQQYEKKYDSLNDNERAKYDILLTHKLQKYISHLSTGRYNQRDFYKNWDLKKDTIDINRTIAILLKTDSLKYKMEQLKPNHIVYKSLKCSFAIIIVHTKGKRQRKSSIFAKKSFSYCNRWHSHTQTVNVLIEKMLKNKTEEYFDSSLIRRF